MTSPASHAREHDRGKGSMFLPFRAHFGSYAPHFCLYPTPTCRKGWETVFIGSPFTELKIAGFENGYGGAACSTCYTSMPKSTEGTFNKISPWKWSVKMQLLRGILTHACNSSTWTEEENWATQRVPGQFKLECESLYQNPTKQTTANKAQMYCQWFWKTLNTIDLFAQWRSIIIIIIKIHGGLCST